jgi:hypothetical protein
MNHGDLCFVSELENVKSSLLWFYNTCMCKKKQSKFDTLSNSYWPVLFLICVDSLTFSWPSVPLSGLWACIMHVCQWRYYSSYKNLHPIPMPSTPVSISVCKHACLFVSLQLPLPLPTPALTRPPVQFLNNKIYLVYLFTSKLVDIFSWFVKLCFCTILEMHWFFVFYTLYSLVSLCQMNISKSLDQSCWWF